jgi:hypothetical protein
MGSINITVPGDINLEYKIENNEVVEKIIQLIKGTGEKKKTGKYQGDDDIVGIWKNRFPGFRNAVNETFSRFSNFFLKCQLCKALTIQAQKFGRSLFLH